MKTYTKRWIFAFTISFLVCSFLVMAFMLFMGAHGAEKSDKAPAASEGEQTEDIGFSDIEDNVGGVSFTEDQITEIARGVFGLDSFLHELSVSLSKSGEIDVGARINDSEKLLESYPELSRFSALLDVVENRSISVSGELENVDGRAAFRIVSASVSGVPIDKGLISPFLEDDEFSELFSVDYDSVDIRDGRIVFSGQLPEMLQY